MNESNRNDDSLESMLEQWGTRTCGGLPKDLSHRVMEDLHQGHREMYMSSRLLVAALLALLSVSALWLGRPSVTVKETPQLGQLNPAATESAGPNAGSLSADAAVEKVQATLNEIQAQLDMVDLESRVVRIQDELQELQRFQNESQRTIRRTIVKQKAIQEWMLAQRTF